MAVKAVTHYRTKNREALLAYLRSREGEHVTVSEIHDHFRQTGSSMGVATIYRQLEQLVSEGQMRKYVVESSSAACSHRPERDPGDDPPSGRTQRIQNGQWPDRFVRRVRRLQGRPGEGALIRSSAAVRHTENEGNADNAGSADKSWNISYQVMEYILF